MTLRSTLQRQALKLLGLTPQGSLGGVGEVNQASVQPGKVGIQVGGHNFLALVSLNVCLLQLNLGLLFGTRQPGWFRAGEGT